MRHLHENATVGPLMTILLQKIQLISRKEADDFLNLDIHLGYMKEFKQKWVNKIRDTLSLAPTKLHLPDHRIPTKN